jgi:hypothetical protein
MKKTNYAKYSLILKEKNRVIFSSTKSGLRPLFECIQEIRGKKYSDCILYDKVIGLAAARLVLHSKIIKTVITPVISEKAQKLLSKHQISISAGTVVKQILNENKTDICPMEKRALSVKSNAEFYRTITHIFS